MFFNLVTSVLKNFKRGVNMTKSADIPQLTEFLKKNPGFQKMCQTIHQTKEKAFQKLQQQAFSEQQISKDRSRGFKVDQSNYKKK